jgi:hypothetical protein
MSDASADIPVVSFEALREARPFQAIFRSCGLAIDRRLTRETSRTMSTLLMIMTTPINMEILEAIHRQ